MIVLPLTPNMGYVQLGPQHREDSGLKGRARLARCRLWPAGIGPAMPALLGAHREHRCDLTLVATLSAVRFMEAARDLRSTGEQ